MGGVLVLGLLISLRFFTFLHEFFCGCQHFLVLGVNAEDFPQHSILEVANLKRQQSMTAEKLPVS